jgi:hypothetical protein
MQGMASFFLQDKLGLVIVLFDAVVVHKKCFFFPFSSFCPFLMICLFITLSRLPIYSVDMGEIGRRKMRAE